MRSSSLRLLILVLAVSTESCAAPNARQVPPTTFPAVQAGEHAFFGAVLEDYEWQRSPGTPPIRGEGVLVREVIPGSPASDSGLAYGDVIIKLDGLLVGYKTGPELSEKISHLSPGQEVALIVLRRETGAVVYPAGAAVPDPPYLATKEIQVRVRLGRTPTAVAAPATRDTATARLAAPACHFIILPSDRASSPAVGGESQIVYVIDEDRGLLSLLACDGKQLEFMRAPVPLDRIFSDIGHKAGNNEIHVAAAVIGSKYSAFVARLPDGGSALYLFDHYGRMAVFKFDSAARKVVPIDVSALREAFK